MGTPENIPGGQARVATFTVTGPEATVARLAATSHSDKWAEAWQVMPHEPSVGQPRWYVVRIEHDGRDGIGFAVIDDRVVADAREAGLPEALGITARMVALLPDSIISTNQARWITGQLARFVAREAGDPPYMDFEVKTWRAVIGVLVEACPENPVSDSLT